MSRTKARVISSLRMRRCSQRRKTTNCTATGMSVVSQLSLCTVLDLLVRIFGADSSEPPRAKAQFGRDGRLRGLESPLPRTEVRGFHQSGQAETRLLHFV